jgi:phosphomannomutase
MPMPPPKDIVLMDMDGTITPPRKHIKPDMIAAILDLCYSADVGIVSGSNIDYVMEQCGNQFITSGMSRRIILMPCNGTKVYQDQKEEYVETYSVSLKNEIGHRLYRKLAAGILLAQSEIIKHFDIPVSGRFLSYRESTLNWSMIGRDSTQDERVTFANRPDRDHIRKDAMYIFDTKSGLTAEELGSIEMVLGGETSIDIYPKGWDKTYALNHTRGTTTWFIGDKCEPGQNDHHIFEELAPHDRAFKSSGPDHTIEIIDHIIAEIKNSG